MIVLDKLGGCLFSDTLNAADVVGTVPHKSFQIDKLNRRNAVILGKFFLVVFHSALGAVVQNCHVVINKLEGVPVPRKDEALLCFIGAEL